MHYMYKHKSQVTLIKKIHCLGHHFKMLKTTGSLELSVIIIYCLQCYQQHLFYLKIHHENKPQTYSNPEDQPGFVQLGWLVVEQKAFAFNENPH